MRMIKVFALVLVAVAAVVVMSASVASAAPTELVQTKGTSKAFTVSNTSADVLPGSTDITCASGLTGSGALKSSTDALVLIALHKCTTLSGLATCTTTGEPSGLIRYLELILFNRKSGKPYLLFEKDGSSPLATFSCAGVPVEVQGTVNGVVSNRKFGEKAANFEYSLEVSGSEQLNMVGEEPTTPMLLEASTNGGKFEPATEEVLKATVAFTEAGAEAEFKE